MGESSRYEIVNLESGKKIRIWKYCYVILSIYINAFDICVHAFIVRSVSQPGFKLISSKVQLFGFRLGRGK